MTYLLASGLLLALGTVITFAFLGRRDARDKADAIKLAADYRSERDEVVRQLAVAREQLAAEQKLRAAAETQRNRAEAALREQMAHLPPDEIDRIAARVFGTPLSMTAGNELEKP